MNRSELLQQKPNKQIRDYVYSSKAILGKGSYGTVLLGRKKETNQLVAMKVLENKTLQAGLNLEIQIMKKFNHPNIVRLLDCFETPNHMYIISEYCNGPDLRQYLAEKKTLGEVEALGIIRDLINGLKEIIQNDVIHRDLKPANIILHNGKCKITDFGFSKPTESTQIMQSLVGTPLYMSPQLLLKMSYTSKCDIWSLGLIFFELLYGDTPWPSTSYVELVNKIRTEPLKFPRNIKISKEVQDFIRGCLGLEEKHRYDWDAVFNHSIFAKTKLCLKLEKIDEDVPYCKTANTTYRLATQDVDQQEQQKLPQLKRDRSNSSNIQQQIFTKILQYHSPQNLIINEQKPRIQQLNSRRISQDKIQEQQQCKQSDSSQSTNCNSQKMNEPEPGKPRYYLNCLNFKNKDNERMRRTKSQLEYPKHNLTDIKPCEPKPKNNFIQENFTKQPRNLQKPISSNALPQPIFKSQIKDIQLRFIQNIEKLIGFLNQKNTLVTFVMLHKQIIQGQIESPKNFWKEGKKIVVMCITELQQKATIFDKQRLLLILLLKLYSKLIREFLEQNENKTKNIDEEFYKELITVCNRVDINI